MRDKVRSALRQLLTPGDRVVCALSGGSDSVALLHCLLSLRQELELTVTAAHFNHCLRGEESHGDEAFVRQLCSQWGVELNVGRGDPRSLTGESPEEAARHLRYEFLMAQSGWIVTAHHGEDQIETVLLNLIRGTGLKGLGGMQPKNGRLLRPMLEVSKEEVEQYLSENGLKCRFDRSNGADDALRNRIRHHILPLLRQENPNLTETFTRMTALLRQDEAYLEEKTAEILQKSAVKDGFDCTHLTNSPAVLRRRAIRQLLDIPKPAMVHVEQVERLLTDCRGSASVDLPGGVTAIREYDVLRFARTPSAGSFAPVVLHPGSEVLLPELGLRVSLQGPVVPETETPFAIRCDGENIAITVRPRQTGDTICLPGGHKTLKKWMIDQKIPAARRDRLPVLVDGQGILAVYPMGCDAARQARPGELAWIISFQNEERETCWKK